MIDLLFYYLTQKVCKTETFIGFIGVEKKNM